MSSCMVITPLPDQFDSQWITRGCTIRRSGGKPQSDQTLWYRFLSADGVPATEDCDAYVRALTFEAMREQRTLVVEGTVSRTLLSNLTEFQAAWNRWVPDMFHHIDYQVQEARSAASHDARPSGALCAFSGGVDATFSVWMHTQNRNGWRNETIRTCALVHGLDIPLSDQSGFDGALQRCRGTLADLDLPVAPIATNYRQIAQAKWEYACGAALVAALDNLKVKAGRCLVGSSEPYDWPVIPWGSSPTTDYLLSSDDFDVLHDGAAYGRTDKVREIIRWKHGVRNLRVCWQGNQRDRNCGQCEKCLRTMMIFVACGEQVPECFPDPGDWLPRLRNLTLRSDLQRNEWRQILAFARKNRCHGAWMKGIEDLLQRKRFSEYFFPVGSKRRAMGNRLAAKLRRQGSKAA